MTSPDVKVVLDRLKLQATESIASAVLRDVDARIVVGDMADDVRVMFESFFLAYRHHPEKLTVEFETPASWWQHAKAQLFPTFSRILRRPPRYRTITRNVTRECFLAFPECDYDFPAPLGRPVPLAILQLVA